MTRDKMKIINDAERVMTEFHKLVLDLRSASLFKFPEGVALIGFHDKSRLYKLIDAGFDNGWMLDISVMAKVIFNDFKGRIHTRTVTVYRITDRLTDDGVADRMLDTLKADLLTDPDSLEWHVISQIENEMFKTDYAKH